MGIHNVTGERLAKIVKSQQSLRAGQIIQGEILKIYPDNKAQIQLGAQKMVAQLEASLMIGEKYHFQVKTTDDVIHLKVLGDRIKGSDTANTINLIKQLGLGSSKVNTAFIQTLLNEKIPFDKNQLVKALQLLNGNAKNTNQTQQILKEMILRKLPMNDSVFQALLIKNSHTLSSQMKGLLGQLKSDRNYPQLVERLSQMLERPLTARPAILNEIITGTASNNQQFFNTLKATGTIDPAIDFNSWRSQWEPVQALMKQNANAPNEQLSGIKLPIQLNEMKVVQTLEQMIINKSGLLNQTREIIQLWDNKINQTAINNVGLTAQDFTKLKQQISQTLMPLLTTEQQVRMTSLLENNPAKLQQLLALVKTLNSEQVYTKADNFVKSLDQDKMFMLSNPKEQFLSQVRQTLLFTGLSYESQLVNNKLQQEPLPIKAMLMQLIQQSEGVIPERSQQLLHFINGMQIQSVNETNNFIQANLQIPGERLGLSNDFELEFEGRKMENGEINPDYCRILFYLDLANLNKTVIDMKIQKRSVAVTIFNDQENMREKSLSLQPMLKNGLEELNYQLSTVSFKPLQQTENQKMNQAVKSVNPSYKGVDYLI
ncbi:hypothetical protein CIL05_08895 [Virgibacillus profundi]|uniref:Flagellar hook-length control protein-like C-terminal domain-containing protein n=1 Tax=Virgibacillus profundi TaxID=2024555 RepID=A0A2A2IFH5_9BACI|nr:hypothetical protein [Virgibacillus profundi]PAV29984.1 hypothetical protein CIL05_08895 [Virgibacillus profundi]PXY54157.1 hypothetical protein CIT14_08980 [Virgibacillus profundi]